MYWIARYNPPASKASTEVANLTERKNTHTPVYGVKEFVCPSVCLSVTKFDPNYKFATLAARAVFVSSFLLQKQLIYDCLAGNNYPNSSHSQWVWNLPHKFHLYLICTVIVISVICELQRGPCMHNRSLLS